VLAKVDADNESILGGEPLGGRETDPPGHAGDHAHLL
jgi:hypothetical protein